MPEILPVKSQNAGQIRAFRNNDFIPVKHGGTGTTKFKSHTSVKNAKGMVVGDGIKPLQLLKCIYDGKRDPTYLDGQGRGYSKGSRWINIDENSEWVCVDSKINRDGAIWIRTASGAGDVDINIRYYGSLVDFPYDYQNYTWQDVNNNFKNEVIQIDYYNEGLTGTYVARMRLTYNTDNQPVKVTMKYISPARPDKSLNFSYANDGYFDTMDRT